MADTFLGILEIQTLKKLPKTAPNMIMIKYNIIKMPG